MTDTTGQDSPSAERLEELAGMMETVGHATRVRIILALAGGAKKSPTVVAAELGVGLGAVAYHFRTLARKKVIRLTSEGRVRGAIEHHYVLAPEGKKLLAMIESIVRAPSE